MDGGSDKDQLAEILFDATLREAFYNHLDSCLMAELLDLWIQLEDFFELEEEKNRVEKFMFICKEFILSTSPNPVNHSYDLLADLRKVHKEISEKGASSPLPSNVLEPCRVATLDLLAYTCLPVFLSSDSYQDFKEGTVDSSKVGFSRYKAEQFFGMKIEGPLKRCDKVAINYGHYRRRPGIFARFFARPEKPETPPPSVPRTHRQLSSNSSHRSVQRESSQATDFAFGGANASDDDKAMGIFGLM